jgi:20S proteasome alpha/beta subunit
MIDEYLTKRREMTYILGSRCKDGVVLIGDRKVTGGTDVNYEDKLFMDIHPMVIGSSGVLGLFEKFRYRLRRYIAGHPNVDISDFIAEIENITRELNQSYKDVLQGQVFDVLIGIKTQDIGALLQYILPIGFAEPIRKYRAIGHGEPYGSIFLKQLWRPDMTME